MPRPERWLVLTATVPEDDPLRELIADGLLALGGTSVLEAGDLLTTYIQPPADPVAFLEHARRVLEDWLGDAPPELNWQWQANEDWEREWRRGLEPRKVSPRFVVKPSWTAWGAAPGEVVIEIDPEMAFGTGEHPTTRGCLRLLDQYLRSGERVLDVGSGSGIQSIAAALAGASDVIAVEFDHDANLNARDNVARNGVGGRIRLIEATADPELLRSLGRFDIIVANILSGVIRPLLPALAEALDSDGRLIVSGIMIRECDTVTADAGAAGLRIDAEDREGDWWSACLVRADG